MAINKDALIGFAAGTGSATSGLGGYKLAQHGLETGSVALTVTGGILTVCGAFGAAGSGTLLVIDDPVLSPIAGVVVGSVATLGAFELADNPVFTLEDFASAGKHEQTLTASEVAQMANPKALNLRFV